MPGTTREIRYKFSADDGVTSVAEKVRRALKGVKSSGAGVLTGESGLLNLARGGGAGIVSVLAGRAMQALPQAAEEYRQALKAGSTVTEALAVKLADALPIVGELAKGFRATIDEFTGENAKYYKQVEAEQMKKAKQEMQTRRDEKRSAFVLPELAKFQDAANDLAIGFKDGFDKASTEALNDHMDRVREIMKNEQLGKSLVPPDLLESFMEEEEKLIQDSALKAGRAMKDIARQRFELQRDENEKVMDLNTAARAQELQNIGQSFEAEAVLRSQALQKQLEDINRREAESKRLGQKIDPKSFQAEADAANAKHNADIAAASERQRIELQQRRQSLAELGLDALRQEAALGNGAAAADVARLEVITKYAAKLDEINTLLKNQGLSENERSLLQSIRGGLGGQEKRALAQLGVGQEHFSGGLAPVALQGHLTGLAAQARDNDPAYRIAKNSDEQTQLQKDIDAKLGQLIARPATGGGAAPANFQ